MSMYDEGDNIREEDDPIIVQPEELGPNVFWIRNVSTGERVMAVPALRDTMQVPIIYYVVFPGQWAQYMGATILKEFFEVEEKCAVQSVEAEPPTIS